MFSYLCFSGYLSILRNFLGLLLLQQDRQAAFFAIVSSCISSSVLVASHCPTDWRIGASRLSRVAEHPLDLCYVSNL